jgi:hypothetical protein
MRPRAFFSLDPLFPSLARLRYHASGQMAQDTLAVAEMVPLKGRGNCALQSRTRTPRFHPCSRADCGRDDIWSLSMKWNFHRSRFPQIEKLNGHFVSLEVKSLCN